MHSCSSRDMPRSGPLRCRNAARSRVRPRRGRSRPSTSSTSREGPHGTGGTVSLNAQDRAHAPSAGTAPMGTDAEAGPAPDPLQNHLLAALPRADYARLAAHLEVTPMPLGEVLYEPGKRLQHVYFPTSAIVSLHYV